jgi:hypothetical protein
MTIEDHVRSRRARCPASVGYACTNHSLAGFFVPAAPSEAELLFAQALTELQFDEPSEDSLRRTHLQHLIHELHSGKLEPIAGINRIEEEVVSPLGRPRDISDWCSFQDSLHDKSDEEARELVRRAVKLCVEQQLSWPPGFMSRYDGHED